MVHGATYMGKVNPPSDSMIHLPRSEEISDWRLIRPPALSRNGPIIASQSNKRRRVSKTRCASSKHGIFIASILEIIRIDGSVVCYVLRWNVSKSRARKQCCPLRASIDKITEPTYENSGGYEFWRKRRGDTRWPTVKLSCE